MRYALILALCLALAACVQDQTTPAHVSLSMEIVDQERVPERLLVDDLRLHVASIELSDARTGDILQALEPRTVDFDFGETLLVESLGTLHVSPDVPLLVTLTVSPPLHRGPSLLLRGLYLPREAQEPVPLPWMDPNQQAKSLAPNAYPFRFESLATATISWEVSPRDVASGELRFPLEVGVWLREVVLQELDGRYQDLGASVATDEPTSPEHGTEGPDSALEAPLHPNFGRVASVERELLLPLLQTMAPAAGR